MCLGLSTAWPCLRLEHPLWGPSQVERCSREPGGLGLDPRGESPHGCRRALRRPSWLRVWQAPLHSGSTSYLTNPGNTLETAHGTVTGCQCLEWHTAAEANEPLRQGVSVDSRQEWGGSAIVPPLQWCPWLLTPRTQPTTQEATPRRRRTSPLSSFGLR